MKERGLKALRGPIYRITDPLVKGMIRAGIHPNAITTMGFVVTLMSGWFFHLDHVRTAGVFVLLGGLLDILDGRVARESGLASKFGSFYDSTLDRISEIVVYIGLASLYNNIHSEMDDVAMIYVIMLAMGGSIMVSYTRARAEGLGLDCKVGMMQRAERVVILGAAAWWFGLDFGGRVLDAAIIVVAVLTNITAIQRIVWVYRHGAGVPLDDALPEKETQK
ncbi:MAG: CDP-alcohol phosphatidyltransferase family protein [Longimicrobiales bacterium]